MMKNCLTVCAAALLMLSARTHAADPPIEEVRAQIPEVRLNRVVFQDGEKATVEVRLRAVGQTKDIRPAIVFSSDTTGDVELVDLKGTADPLVYSGNAPVTLRSSGGPADPQDGVLDLQPGDLFTAMLSYDFTPAGQQQAFQLIAADWGVMDDPNLGGSTVEVVPGAVLTPDEVNPPSGSRPFGTLFVAGAPGPVQVASKELLFLPESEEQFQEFMNRTGGTVLGYQGSTESEPKQLPDAGTAWLRVQVSGDPVKIDELPMLRALFGDDTTLTASNEDTMALVATAMELVSDGFAVGLNPRLQLHGRLHSPEGAIDTVRIDAYGNFGGDNPNNVHDPVYGIRGSWAKIAMFDFDENAVPVGVIDSGFAPNPDFKTSHPLYFERNLSNGTSGIGSAQTPQEVGNSGFGGKTWHGNGTVTTISGVPGNYYGYAGIGGQTAVPKLYHMGLASFAMGFGTAIDLAVNDGVSVINISAGYPCRILSVLGNDNICSPGSRAIFMAKLGAAVRGAAAAACAAGGLLDAFLPGLGTAVCVSAVVAAETASIAFFSTTFLGETRGPVETAVARATSLGVPIVASAGNNLDGGGVPEPLASLVQLSNNNIDDWQIIPAVIPDVIAVGASDRTNNPVIPNDGYHHRANVQFWGDSVDIWAPEGSYYWAPEDGEADPATVPVTAHIQRTFGGTSNSAPYVTGVIANVMAIDPSFDRRFVAPTEWPNLTQRILDHLLATAYNAGDPECPDSADDVVTYLFDPETEMNVEVDEPAWLLAQMERRRNMINPGAAVDLAIANLGRPDFAALGYDIDLGQVDDFADSAPPSDVREPLLDLASFSAVDEINGRDREFWFVRIPSTGRLYQHRIELTIPTLENRVLFLVNGVPGTPVTTSGPEQTLSWETPPAWSASGSRYFPLAISGATPTSDSIYKLNVTRSTIPPPDADVYDLGPASNETLDEATVLASWQSVPGRSALEVEAFEICVEDLTFHRPDDVDVFEVQFPEPPLDVPNACSSLNPWVTFRLEPPTPTLLIEVFSRSGGTDTRLARGSGGDTVRLDCRDYLGRLPLYVKVSSPSQAAIPNYDLKVRWSEPSEDLDDRLTSIREAWAARQVPPFEEQFFPPPIPWLRTSPGLIPPSVVNPNPAFEQELGDNGQFLASRLFLFELPKGGVNATFATITPISQSLRLEIVDLSGQVLDADGTPDLGFQVPKGGVTGATRVLSVDINGFNSGVYLLRLSGHAPGDRISLYLSQDLVPEGALSIESLSGAGQGIPTLLPPLPGFDGLNRQAFASTAFFPEYPPHHVTIERAVEVLFQAEAEVGYQIEMQGPDGVWAPVGERLVYPEAETGWDVLLPSPGGLPAVRIAKLGGAGSFPPDAVQPALMLRYQSVPDVSFSLQGSLDLQEFGVLETSLMGDGTVFESKGRYSDLPGPSFFIKLTVP